MSVAKCRTLFLARWIAAPILLLGLLTMLGILMRVPTFDGKTTRAWLMDVAYGPNPASAVEVFKRTGSPMVSGLIRTIEGRGLRIAQWLRSHPSLFSHLPSGAQKHVTKKIETECHLRSWAIEMCAVIGPAAKSAHPVLLRACADPDRGVRGPAAKALAKTQVRPEVAVPALVRMLGDREFAVRAEAAKALGLYGSAAKAAIPALRKGTNDTDGIAAFSARLGLAMIETPEKVKKLPFGNDAYRLLP